MHDLNVINRLNAEAIERDIPTQRRNGHYVVAEYTGLNFAGYHIFDNERDANKKACELGQQPGGRSHVYKPSI